MNLKNEKSKIYSFGKIFFTISIIGLGIIFFMNRPSQIPNKIIDIQLIFLALSNVLLGTQIVVARKNYTGILNYLFAGVFLVVFILRVFG